jgi:FMN-dependent NADH-azoreductase
MAKVLLVKGHPGTSAISISVKMLERFQADYAAKNPGDTIEVVDVYNDNVPLIDADVLSAYGKFQSGRAGELTPAEGAKIGRMTQLADQFLAADKVVFAGPMWNFGYPPMLKAYIDAAVVVQGKTFTYSEQGPTGMLKGQGKKAVILEASGTHFTGTPAEGYTHASNHLKGLLQFIGIEDIEFVAAEGVGQFPDKREAIINEALNKVSSVAAAA